MNRARPAGTFPGSSFRGSLRRGRGGTVSGGEGARGPRLLGGEGLHVVALDPHGGVEGDVLGLIGLPRVQLGQTGFAVRSRRSEKISMDTVVQPE